MTFLRSLILTFFSFYIIIIYIYFFIGGLPNVVYLLEKAKDKKNLIAFLLSVVSVLVLILLSIMFRQYSNTLLDNNSFGYFSALNQFPCFCLGITLFFQKRDTSFCSRKIMKIFFGVLLLIISVLLFYRPIIPYSFQLIPSFFGMAFYLIFRVLLDFHFENPFFNVIKLLGRNSYYMFLTHAFFVWPFPSLVIKLGKKINFNQNLLFVILLPISVILTYISAEYLKLIVLKIKKHFIDYCGSI